MNLIPVIAKADVITKNELEKLRAKIMGELVANGVDLYKFPTDDADVTEINNASNALIPFAVVASHEYVRVGNKQLRARQYPWGTVQGLNDFSIYFDKSLFL